MARVAMVLCAVAMADATIPLTPAVAAQPSPPVLNEDAFRAKALEFADAVSWSDIGKLEPLLALDFVEIGPRGGITRRAEFLSDIRASRQFIPGPELRREWSDVSLVVAPDRATFVGRSTWRLNGAPGRTPSASVLLTQHWRLANGRWQVVSLQRVRLPPPPEVLSFRSGELELKGMLFRPQGDGRYPLIVYAHGNEPDPRDLFESVAPPLVARGYVVFGPHRRGAGLSAGQGEALLRTLTAIEQRGGVDARSRAAIAALEGPHLDDMAAAIAFARSLPFVDPNRVYMIGNSFGGVLAVLAAERGLGLRAAADFAGSALNWDRSDIFRARLTRAAANAKIPLFVGQAENDFSTSPTRELAKVLAANGKPHRAKLYPPFGVTRREGHALGVNGVDIWASDVLSFFDAAAAQGNGTKAAGEDDE